jgi:arsenate reductase
MLVVLQVLAVVNQLFYTMFTNVKATCDQFISEFDQIPMERKVLLEKITAYLQAKIAKNVPIQLMYVCTHNSRRSHFGQIWGAVAATYFSIPSVETFSGGTEATAMHANAIAALKSLGFEIEQLDETKNPRLKISFSDNNSTVCFSKTYDDAFNPQDHFAAIMTCSDAEENCPFIPGVELRIGTTYDDPKAYDGTDLQNAKYIERSLQIGREIAYSFYKINN